MIYTDQIGQQLKLLGQAQRIISLVPSMTELLFELGLEKQIIACTKFCEHPAQSVKQIPKIGGTKNPHLDKIIALKPDLIFAAKEENIKEHVDILSVHCPVYTSNVTDIPTSIEMIQTVAAITNTKEQSKSIEQVIIDESRRPINDTKVNCLYLIWKDPYMCAGGDTFINSMLDWGGFNNLAANRLRYPSFTIEEINTLNPQLLMLSSEPFPFADKHILEIQSHFPNSKVLLVDGQPFSWYGSRMTSAFNYIRLLKSSV